MKRTVYVETTIPSFYHEVRDEPDMVARRMWTRQWWNDVRESYRVVTSAAVIDELEQGDYPTKEKALALVEPLPILPVEPEILPIVETYIRHHLMPRDPFGDALHLALASYHKCDFLLTWNCSNLANANKFDHIRRINTMLGLYVPLLVTPLEMLGGP
ncbi:MAG: PIN domain-containing protein [Bacteroidetes bacterium]|jgi:predicted nucleic acid-binding protein|nr:PIN domain-containing protein [Bacteroidota bacterium]